MWAGGAALPLPINVTAVHIHVVSAEEVEDGLHCCLCYNNTDTACSERCSNFNMAPTQDKEKKSKLGRIFGSGGGESSKKDQHINQDGGKPQTLRPSAESVHDSAYASSENANKGSSGENIVHVDNKGQIDGVDQDRSLAYNKSTGDVFDEDTGETVVTTTTTTTTTTTHRPGGRKELKTEVKTDGGEPIATAAAAGSDPGVAELPASRSPAPPGGGHDSPPVPVRNPHRRMSREGEQPVSPQTQTSPQYQMFNPPPAPGGPTGHSPQEGPPGSAGPAKTNFSYPSRTEPPPPQANMGPPPEQQPGYRGTMDNLKAAAAGIHVSMASSTPQFNLLNQFDRAWEKPFVEP